MGKVYLEMRIRTRNEVGAAASAVLPTHTARRLKRGLTLDEHSSYGSLLTYKREGQNHMAGRYETMSTYIILLNFTDQGIRNVRDLPQRLDAARQVVEAAGGTLQTFLTMGQYDAVAIGEASSDEAIATILLAIGSRGNVRTTVLKAFNEEETRKIIAGLPPA